MNFKSRSLNIRIIFLFIALSFFTGCYSEAEKTVLNYFKALSTEKFKDAYILLSEKDRSTLSFEEFSKNDGNALSRMINKKMNYKILTSTLSETKESAFVEIELYKIDAAKILKLIPELNDKNLSLKNVEKIFNRERGVIKGSYKKDIIKYTLVKVNNQWKIIAGYVYKKRINELLSEAEKAFLENDYDEALRSYKNILDFDNENFDAFNKISIITEKINYINKYVKAKIQYSEEKQGKIYFEAIIENSGTIMVKNIYGKVNFYNKNKMIRQEKVNFNENFGFKDKKKMSFSLNIPKLTFNKIEFEVYAVDF